MIKTKKEDNIYNSIASILKEKELISLLKQINKELENPNSESIESKIYYFPINEKLMLCLENFGFDLLYFAYKYSDGKIVDLLI